MSSYYNFAIRKSFIFNHTRTFFMLNNRLLWLILRKLTLGVITQNCIQEVPGLNLGRDI
jgi:hypothetical protein